MIDILAVRDQAAMKTIALEELPEGLDASKLLAEARKAYPPPQFDVVLGRAADVSAFLACYPRYQDGLSGNGKPEAEGEEGDMAKATVVHPGIRGGVGYFDASGWHYGERPVVHEPTVLAATSMDDIDRGMGYWDNAAQKELHPERYVLDEGGHGPYLVEGQVETRFRVRGGRPELYDITPLPKGMSVDEMMRRGWRWADGAVNILYEVPDSTRPPEYVFRAVTEQDYQRMKAAGVISTDGRGNIATREGVVTAVWNPSTYLPHDGEGRIIRIRYVESDGWASPDGDEYVKAGARPIPFERVDLVSPVIVRKDWGTVGVLAKAAVEHPGSRGGKGYWDARGVWQYGERPLPESGASDRLLLMTTKGPRRFAEWSDEKIAEGIADTVRQHALAKKNNDRSGLDSLEKLNKELLAERDARKAMPVYDTTCQVCARPIQAKTGKIAHHGYKRPGQGWQTASCFGARYRPYEVASDALPLVIEHIKTWIASTTGALANLEAEPPESFTVHPKILWQGQPNREPYTVTRPAGFVVEAEEPHEAGMPRTYEAAFYSQRREFRNNIETAKRELPFLQKRLADWKPVELTERPAEPPKRTLADLKVGEAYAIGGPYVGRGEPPVKLVRRSDKILSIPRGMRGGYRDAIEATIHRPDAPPKDVRFSALDLRYIQGPWTEEKK